jgi:hypothetical protein
MRSPPPVMRIRAHYLSESGMKPLDVAAAIPNEVARYLILLLRSGVVTVKLWEDGVRSSWSGSMKKMHKWFEFVLLILNKLTIRQLI